MVLLSFIDEHTYLAAQLADPAHQSLLNQLCTASSQFPHLASWQAFAQLIQRPSTTPAQHNAVLSPLIRMHATRGDSRTANVLTFAFWPRLLSIHRRAHKWEQNHQDLWQNIILSFLETLLMPKLLFAKDIAKCVYFRTRARLYRIYSREWARESRIVPVSCHILADVVHTHESGFTRIELRDELRASYAAIRQQRELGVIDPNDFHLIVATRLCGKSLKDVAKRQDLTYDAAKCRRDRAERCLATRGLTLPHQGKHCCKARGLASH